MIITDLNILRQKSIATSIQECREKRVFEQMENELKSSKIAGIGLSAIQIGIPIQACIIRMEDLKLNILNPIIEKIYEPMIISQNEGCLSLPGVNVDVDRYGEVLLRYIDFDEGFERRAVFTKMQAIVIQHECQHLDGILITDVEHKKDIKIGRNDKCPECKKLGIEIKYKRCKLHFK